MELLFVVPILALLFSGALGYAHLAVLRANVNHAAIAGAREAGKGGDQRDVAETMNRVLACCGAAETLEINIERRHDSAERRTP